VVSFVDDQYTLDFSTPRIPNRNGRGTLNEHHHRTEPVNDSRHPDKDAGPTAKSRAVSLISGPMYLMVLASMFSAVTDSPLKVTISVVLLGAGTIIAVFVVLAGRLVRQDGKARRIGLSSISLAVCSSIDLLGSAAGSLFRFASRGSADSRLDLRRRTVRVYLRGN
jgi:hypothetical protein